MCIWKSGMAKTAKYSVVFCLENATQKADTYKVSSVSFDDDGNVDITAIYWPEAESGLSKIAEEWATTNFEIDG